MTAKYTNLQRKKEKCSVKHVYIKKKKQVKYIDLLNQIFYNTPVKKESKKKEHCDNYTTIVVYLTYHTVDLQKIYFKGKIFILITSNIVVFHSGFMDM